MSKHRNNEKDRIQTVNLNHIIISVMIKSQHKFILLLNSFVTSIKILPTMNAKDASIINTTSDVVMSKTRALFELSFRVINAANELSSYCKVLDRSSKR